MKRTLCRRVGLICAGLLSLCGAGLAQAPAATPAAEPSVTNLLDSLYPEGVPGETDHAPASPSADTTPAEAAVETVDVASSSSTTTAVLAPAGTLRVRRSRKPAVRIEASTTTTKVTTTTTTGSMLDTSATTGTTATRSLAHDGATTRSLIAGDSADHTAPVRLDGFEPVASTTATTATTATIGVHLPPPGSPPNPDGVWINRASPVELERKLKLDARRARLILEFRETYGFFHTPDDLTQVTGITDDMVRRWESDDLLFFN